jgi:hypothetical protein
VYGSIFLSLPCHLHNHLTSGTQHNEQIRTVCKVFEISTMCASGRGSWQTNRALFCQ